MVEKQEKYHKFKEHQDNLKKQQGMKSVLFLSEKFRNKCGTGTNQGSVHTG